MEQIATTKRQVTKLGNGLLLRTDRQLPYIRLKIVRPEGIITYLDVDRTMLTMRLNELRDEGVIVVGEWCPAELHDGPGALCQKCNEKPVKCACVWPLPRGVEHHELTEYPGGIEDPKLKAEIAKRCSEAEKVRMAGVALLPQMVLQKQQVHAFRQALDEGGDREMQKLRAENASLRAEVAETKAMQKEILDRLDQRPKK